MKDVHQLRCPCCQKNLEFEAGTGKVRVIKDEKVVDEGQMDRLVDVQKQEAERLGDSFSQATDAVARQADKFDDMFSSALDEAKKDKDKKPRNPFDLD